MLLVDRAHQRGGRWQHFIDEDEDSLLWSELDTLPDHVYELTNGQILQTMSLMDLKRGELALVLTHGTRYFFLSMVAISDFSSFSQMT